MTWRARLTKFNEELKSDSLDLTKHLARFTDVVDCPAGPRFCVFDVPLKDDKASLNPLIVNEILIWKFWARKDSSVSLVIKICSHSNDSYLQLLVSIRCRRDATLHFPIPRQVPVCFKYTTFQSTQ